MAKKIFTTIRNSCRARKFVARQNDGSALLIAMLLMGILITLSLGVSGLLIGTLRDSRLLLEKTRAWYAAESGLEHALFAVSEHGPGFGAKETMQLPDAHFSYDLIATAKKIPNKELDSEESYSSLGLNESVVIPLFRTLESGAADPVKNFRVDYYLPLELQKHGGVTYSNLDVLRWKIFGLTTSGLHPGAMEVVNEFLPMAMGQNTANNPSCLGNPLSRSDCWNGARYFQFNGETGEYNPVEKFPIETFMNQHTQNFLVLTNIVNTDLIASFGLTDAEKKKMATIQYRIAEEDGDENPRLTLPTIHIKSDGFSGGTKQSIDVTVKRETSLPVFDYALYRTKDGQ